MQEFLMSDVQQFYAFPLYLLDYAAQVGKRCLSLLSLYEKLGMPDSHQGMPD